MSVKNPDADVECFETHYTNAAVSRNEINIRFVVNLFE